jgi:hypothetical protein
VDSSILATLVLAFGLGLLHALDADHVIAVSTLASRRPGLRQALGFCARWAVGHAASVLALGAAVLLAGSHLPPQIGEHADRVVGLVLIGLGVWVFWDLRRRRLHVHAHAHDGLPGHVHVHWHRHDDRVHRYEPEGHAHDHGALLVGVLHGVAGSAPVIALVPLARMATPAWGIVYLAVFSLGVLASMTIVGGLIGVCFERLDRIGPGFFATLRALVAVASIGVGSAMML